MQLKKSSISLYVLTFCVLLLLTIIRSPATATESLPTGEDWIKQIAADINSIDTTQLLQLLEEQSDLELIDVRTLTEIADSGGMIDAGRRTHAINRGWIEFQVADRVPDLNTTLVVYCDANLRSPLAVARLQQMGYSRVYNYSDGLPGWVAAKLPLNSSDEYVGSMLYRAPMEVQDGVWSAIGATAPPSYENSGHNNNLSFVIGDDAVLVVNASDNYLLAKSLHSEIKAVTDLPVTHVVLENGQGHAMLGMSYWQEQGAEIVAHAETAAVIEERGEIVLDRMRQRNRDKSMGTRLVEPDVIFEDDFSLDLGNRAVEVKYLGPSHSPGDTTVWLPESQLVIAGDMAFHERLLPVFDDTDTAGWVETWKRFRALQADVIIPGHGHPTTIDVVEKWTRDYLIYMRSEIAKILNDGGSLIDAYKIDQSAYQHLDTFDELAGLNADRIYRAMEFE